MTVSALTLVVAAVMAAQPGQPSQAPATAPDAPSAAPRPFRCDGTDGFFFDELQRAGKVGYGETWDATLCDEGAAVYAEGDARLRSVRRTRRPATKDEQALAMVVPLTVGGGLTFIVGAAAVLGWLGRLRRRVVLEAPCPSCGAALPVEAGEGGTQLFCPMCGAACAIVIQGRGRNASAHASPLR
ncbi:MAG: hypothetical protein HYS27_15245 [Deltaproteobacteria bacterium]|nr:hypothetical protein [Deltaproteobacteria bacterium]